MIGPRHEKNAEIAPVESDAGDPCAARGRRSYFLRKDRHHLKVPRGIRRSNEVDVTREGEGSDRSFMVAESVAVRARLRVAQHKRAVQGAHRRYEAVEAERCRSDLIGEFER